MVGKGRSTPVDGPEGEWSKLYYQLEAMPGEGEDIGSVKTMLEEAIDLWLSSQTSPSFQPGELDALPWVSYQTKEHAAQDEAGWVFAKNKGAEKLAETIRRSGGKLTLGSFEYRLSGDEDQFLTRRPIKK